MASRDRITTSRVVHRYACSIVKLNIDVPIAGQEQHTVASLDGILT
jgi:hypothetical protein